MFHRRENPTSLLGVVGAVLDRPLTNVPRTLVVHPHVPSAIPGTQRGEGTQRGPALQCGPAAGDPTTTPHIILFFLRCQTPRLGRVRKVPGS